MFSSEVFPSEQEPAKIQNLGDFDQEYFQELEGENGWSAIGQENCTNQRYFVVYGSKGEKLGIVGVYDTAEEKNVTHTVVDPKYRGQGLAAEFKQRLMDELKLPFITMTIDLDNEASIRATEKLPGVKKVSDAQYEQDFHKVKYTLEKPAENLETTSETELTIEERKKLAGVWRELVLGNNKDTPEQAMESDEALKEWMFQSLMAQADQLVDEWGLMPDAKLVEQMQSETDVTKKAELEAQLLKQIQQNFADYIANFDHSGQKGTKWDSWPAIMKQSKEFNCVGTTLLSSSILRRLGITYFDANPIHHSVNVAQLADGQYWYVDFLNGKSQVKPVEITEDEIGGAKVWRLKDDVIDYQIIKVSQPEQIIAAVIGNFNSLQHEAQEPTKQSDPDQVQAKQYYQEHEDTFTTVNFYDVSNHLFPLAEDYYSSAEYQQEEKRIKELHNDTTAEQVGEYLKPFNPDQQQIIITELAKHLVGIADYLYNDAEEILHQISPESSTVVRLYYDNLIKIKAGNFELFDERVKRFLAGIMASI